MNTGIAQVNRNCMQNGHPIKVAMLGSLWHS
ncbi:hypothetical protein X768_22525 [Mesorhizobium sp. LSJC265A00]|nr:hypothetical protein X768_22525 [Mesorhizobium sp. LSJC265A00]